jgi:outer membrane receptor protein involved in Fe transport
MRHSRTVFSFVFILLLFSISLTAQTFRGSIQGTVTDSSGAVIPEAQVTVKNVDTGLERKVTTDQTGFFVARELPIGNYQVTVEKQGFQRAVASNVPVEVAVTRRVDVTMQAGSAGQVTEVTGEIPLVDSRSNTLGGSFIAEQVENLPVNGRDFTKLLIMVPGTAGEPNGGGDSPGSFGLFSANGNRGRSNNFLLDGTDMNDGYRNLPAINQGGVFGTPGTVLPVDSIAEVNVLTNVEAEYGRNSGSVVNIVTKSGTNQLHGSLFEYFRNDHLNARNFFNTEGPKDAFRNNQFGGALGGPIFRDKTFFYFTYEGQREGLGVTSVNRVPGPTDFADAITALGGNPAIPIATNPAVNPVIRNLFSFCAANGGCSGGNTPWPTPNRVVTSPDEPNSISSAAAFNDVDSLIAKIDHNFNQRNHLSGRYFFGQSDQSFPLGLAGGNNLPGTNTTSPIRTQLVSISHVTVLSDNLVNEARFGWNRYKQNFFPEDAAVFGNPNDSIGLNTGITNQRDFGLPQIGVSGFAALGSSGFSNPRGRVDTNWQAIDNVSWKIGAHDAKFGYEFRRTTVDSFNDFNFRGRLAFGSLEDFLSGTVTGFSLIPRGDTDRRTGQNSNALYVQDSFRLRRDLTLNAGLRWDYFGVIHEENNQFSTYDPATGLQQVDQLYDKDFNNFSPRLGFAWDVGGKGKTVVRGGYSIAYDIFSQDFFTGQIFFNSFNAGPAYNAIGPNPIQFSFLNFGGVVPVLSPGAPIFPDSTFSDDTTDVAMVARNLPTPYVQTFSLNVQQELMRDTVLQVGYVNSGGRKLFRFRDINQPSQAEITAHDLACNCTDGVGRPFDNSAPLNTATDASGNPIAPNPPFYVNQLETSSTSNYNALQLSLRQQRWHGLTHQLSWTYSHSIDDASDGQDFVPNAAQPNDSRAPGDNRGNSNFDTRHRFVWSASYEFPSSEWAPLKGWSMHGVLTLMSGHPFHVNNNFFDDFDGSGELFGRPDVVAPIVTNQSNPFEFLDLSSFQIMCTPIPGSADSAAGCVPGTRHFGNLGRNSIPGPNYRNFDFALAKSTRISERMNLLLRMDVFNFTNHPNFANPLLPTFIADAFFNGINPNTGRSEGFLPIVATSDVGLGNPILGGGGPRSFQFSAKFTF